MKIQQSGPFKGCQSVRGRKTSASNLQGCRPFRFEDDAHNTKKVSHGNKHQKLQVVHYISFGSLAILLAPKKWMFPKHFTADGSKIWQTS